MKLIISLLTLLLCLFPLTTYPQDWDLLNEPFDNLDNWADEDGGAGVSEIDPAGQLRMDTNTAGGLAQRRQDIGAYPQSFTYEIKVYHDNIGTLASGDWFEIYAFSAANYARSYVAIDGFFCVDTGSGATEVGVNLVKEGEDQTWRLLYDLAAGTADVYLYDSTHNWELVGDDIPCEVVGVGVNGNTYLIQNSATDDNVVTHVDWVKADSDHFIPTPVVAAAQVIKVKTNF